MTHGEPALPLFADISALSFQVTASLAGETPPPSNPTVARQQGGYPVPFGRHTGAESLPAASDSSDLRVLGWRERTHRVVVGNN